MITHATTHDDSNDIDDIEAAEDAMWAVFAAECEAADDDEFYAEEHDDDRDDDAFDWSAYDDAEEFN